MSYTLETFTHKGYTVKIISDEDAPNPRKDYDNAGTMVCWHSRYDLGDEQRRDDPEDWRLELATRHAPNLESGLDNTLYTRMVTSIPDSNSGIYKTQRKAWNRKRHEIIEWFLDRHYIMLPLGLYDHSGITMYIGSAPIDCGGWDSGQVGWIYISKTDAVKQWGTGPEARELAIKCLTTEVETYDQYLTGDVWGYTIEDPDGNDIDSCWGMFGSDYCKQEAIDACPDEPAMVGGIGEDEAHEETLA